MKEKLRLAVFGHKRWSREGGVEIVVKELCTRMAQQGCQVTCYNRSGHHVSGAEYDDAGKTEYEGIRQKSVPTIERRGLAAVSSSAFAALYSAFGKYDVVHIHAERTGVLCMAAEDVLGKELLLPSMADTACRRILSNFWQIMLTCLRTLFLHSEYPQER